MRTGIIVKALAGFYYVNSGDGVTRCRARGRFRLEGESPLVGDRVEFEPTGDEGFINAILERRNAFVRPAVANIDRLVILASAAIPATDPFLIDRVAVIAESLGCKPVIVLNKCDLDRADALYEIYSKTPYSLIRTSAVTGEGVERLRAVLRGTVSAFTGNSGVGKSSLLNALNPQLGLEIGEVSHKLGRGRHTTRHVELFRLSSDSYIADTPGFAGFDLSQMPPIDKRRLQELFPDFKPYLGACRFDDCAHISEPGCAVLDAVRSGAVSPSRHSSYKKLYEICSQFKPWDKKA